MDSLATTVNDNSKVIAKLEWKREKGEDQGRDEGWWGRGPD